MAFREFTEDERKYMYHDTGSLKQFLNTNYVRLAQKGCNMMNNTFVIHENGKAIILNKAAIVSIEQETRQCTIRTINDDLQYNPDESYNVVVRRFFK